MGFAAPEERLLPPDDCPDDFELVAVVAAAVADGDAVTTPAEPATTNGWIVSVFWNVLPFASTSQIARLPENVQVSAT